MKTQIPKEDQESKAFADYLRLKGFKFTHIANERRTSIQQGVKLKKLGVSPGVPDFMIILPCLGATHILFIEMKRSKKSLSKVSESQKGWINAINECTGSMAGICYGADDAIKIVEYFIK